MAAEADKVIQLGAFASTNHNEVLGYTYYDRLAENGIISVNGNAPLVGESHFNAPGFANYQWSYLPDWEKIQRQWGEWICNQFAGRTASYAGPGSQGQPRKFGYFVHTYLDATPSTDILDSILGGCGATPVIKLQRRFAESFGAPTPGSIQEGDTQMAQMKTEGVTSIICVCHAAPLRGNEMPAATRQLFFPEWITSSFVYNDWDRVLGYDPQEQMRNSFGINFHSKSVQTADLPITWAMKKVDPLFDWNAEPDCATSGGGGDLCAHIHSDALYPALLMLASGIQMAGPTLNPTTFANGLQGAAFPNPQDNNYAAGHVGADLNAGRHNMVDDAATVWRGIDRPSTWGGTGAWCFWNSGKRYRLGQWPSGQPDLFTGGCS